MTLVERTAYRVFPRLVMTRELYFFYSPPDQETAWAREKTDTERTAESHRVLVRRREGVGYAPAQAMTRAAWVKNHPPDLINVALERLAQARLEPPAFSTLDSMESTIRSQVNGQIFETIWRRLSAEDRVRLAALLVVGPGGKSDLID